MKIGLSLAGLGALIAVLLPVLLLSSVPAAATPAFVVNSPADVPDASPGDGSCDTGGGVCTLRAAIQEANALLGQDTVVLQPNTTYLLERPGQGDANGDLNISSDLVIIGAGASSSVIDGNGSALNWNVMTVAVTGTAVISGVTIRNGRSPKGAGIWNQGMLVLRNSAVVGNTSVTPGFGAGINNDGTLTLEASQILSNTGNGDGGGFFNYVTGRATIINSIVSANTSTGPGPGGGITNYGVLTLTGSTVSRNKARLGGGGIRNSGALALVNSTLSGNRSDDNGGGLFQTAGATASLYNATIAFNAANADGDTAGGGGGIYNISGTVILRNSIVANNDRYAGLFVVSNDCSGVLNSSNYNLMMDNSGCTIVGAIDHNQTGINPLLGVLQRNGGATPTHALRSGSPAIDAGNPSGCTGLLGALLTTDQRGFPRVVDGDRNGSLRCDIGAFEYLPPLFLPLIQR